MSNYQRIFSENNLNVSYSDNKQYLCIFDHDQENAFIFMNDNNNPVFIRTLKGDGTFISDHHLLLFYNDGGYGYCNTDSYIYDLNKQLIMPLYCDNYEQISYGSKRKNYDERFFISFSSKIITTKKYFIVKNEHGGVCFYYKSEIIRSKKLKYFFYLENNEANKIDSMLNYDEAGCILEYLDYEGNNRKIRIDFNAYKPKHNKPYELKLKSEYFNGFSLDYHTISSHINPDGFFDTLRTKIGELLYQLKYHGDKSCIQEISNVAASFISTEFKKNPPSVLIPIPSSSQVRNFQPVIELAKVIEELTQIPVNYNYLIKQRNTPEIKGIDDNETRKEMLKNAFHVIDKRYKGKTILLFDDLYRSGETLNAAAKILKEQGNVGKIYVLTITKTRTKR